MASQSTVVSYHAYCLLNIHCVQKTVPLFILQYLWFLFNDFNNYLSSDCLLTLSVDMGILSICHTLYCVKTFLTILHLAFVSPAYFSRDYSRFAPPGPLPKQHQHQNTAGVIALILNYCYCISRLSRHWTYCGLCCRCCSSCSLLQILSSKRSTCVQWSTQQVLLLPVDIM